MDASEPKDWCPRPSTLVVLAISVEDVACYDDHDLFQYGSGFRNRLVVAPSIVDRVSRSHHHWAHGQIDFYSPKQRRPSDESANGASSISHFGHY